MKKIVHITTGHNLLDTRIFYRECKTLVEAGYEVVFIVPHDRDEVIDGVQIRSVPKSRSRWDRMTGTVWAEYRIAMAENAEVYHFHEYDLIPAGILLKLFGKKVVYDVHESLSHRIMGDYNKDIPRWLRKIFAKIAKHIEKAVSTWFFDGVVAATPAIARHFPQAKTYLIQNFPALEELPPNTHKPSPEDLPLVVYAGEITTFRGVSEMISAMDLLPEQLNANMILLGRFSPSELEKEVKQIPGWERVQYLGWKSRELLIPLVAKAHVGLVLYHPLPNHTEAQPNKLFEYMSLNIPVVASDFPLWRKIVGEINCGLLVDPLDPQAIAEAIQWLLEHPNEAEAMGKRGQEAVLKQYNWKIESQKLVNFYSEIVHNS